jgi:hypothetical protein
MPHTHYFLVYKVFTIVHLVFTIPILQEGKLSPRESATLPQIACDQAGIRIHIYIFSVLQASLMSRKEERSREGLPPGAG